MAHHNPHYNWVVLHPLFFRLNNLLLGPFFIGAHQKKTSPSPRFCSLSISETVLMTSTNTPTSIFIMVTWGGADHNFRDRFLPIFFGEPKRAQGQKKTICIAESIKEKLTHLFWSTKFWSVLGWNHLEFAQSSDLKHWIPTVILKKKHQGLCFIERSQAGTDDCFHSCYPTSYYQLERQIKTSKKHLQSPSLPGKKQNNKTPSAADSNWAQ